MGSQVVASCGKLNLRRDLRWVAKWTGKFPHKYTQVAWKNILTQTILYFIGWVAKRQKTCFDSRANLISTKVSASQRKCSQGLAKRSRR